METDKVTNTLGFYGIRITNYLLQISYFVQTEMHFMDYQMKNILRMHF